MSDNKNTRDHVANVAGNAAWTMGEITNALAPEPRIALAYVRFAIFYQSEGMLDETVAVLDKGLKIAPNDEILLMMRRDVETSVAPRQLARP